MTNAKVRATKPLSLEIRTQYPEIVSDDIELNDGRSRPVRQIRGHQ